MKQFWSFVKKEFYHILRDKRTLLILLVMPIAEIILFGFAITTEVKDVRVAVFDQSKDIITQKIIDLIGNNAYFHITHTAQSAKQIDDLFLTNKIDAAVVFPPQFAKGTLDRSAAVQVITDATDPNMANMTSGYLSAIIAQSAENVSQTSVSTQTVNPIVKMLYNPQMKSAYNFVPGVMGLILMLICAMMTSISIVREKERGTMEVLLVSPMKPFGIVLAKAVPYFLLSVVNLLTILLLSVFVLNVPIAGSLITLSLLSFLFILVSLSLGLLISTLVKTQVAAMLASGMVLMMPVMILSGLIFPVESMPVVLRAISYIIPAKWYIEGVKKVMIEGLPIQFISVELLILSLMATLILVVSIKKYKIRLS